MFATLVTPSRVEHWNQNLRPYYRFWQGPHKVCALCTVYCVLCTVCCVLCAVCCVLSVAQCPVT